MSDFTKAHVKSCHPDINQASQCHPDINRTPACLQTTMHVAVSPSDGVPAPMRHHVAANSGMFAPCTLHLSPGVSSSKTAWIPAMTCSHL